MTKKVMQNEPETLNYTVCVECKRFGSHEKYDLEVDYPPPQQRKPMTDKQIDEIPFALFVPDQDGMSTTEELRKFARAIEAAHGIKE